MYSTKLDKNRYNIICLAVLNNISKLILCVDTGARYTCCSYNDIDEYLTEKDFEDSEFKILGGFVEGTTMKFYKYHLNQFTIGNINLKEQDIWVTFDDRVSDAVLGMDILSQVTFLGIENTGKLIFFNGPDEMTGYITNKV